LGAGAAIGVGATTGTDSGARRFAQSEAVNARLTTHMRPIQGEPRMMKTSQTTDSDTANAATPVQRFDTMPSLEVALPRFERMLW